LYQYDETAVFAVQIPAAEIQEIKIEQVQQVVANFECIVGCFSDERNASNLVQKLQSEGFNAHTLPGGNLIRVSAGSGSNQQEIQEIQAKVNSLGMEGWVAKQ
jgi:cell division septation protein DedD